jgi:hypothetical protein
MPQFESDARGGFFERDGLVACSPDGVDSLYIVAHNPELTEETVGLDVLVWEHDQAQPSGVDFTLTWFDFPLTDNTLLKDGNRFALVLHNFQVLPAGERIVHVQVVWFPRNYFTPRERPVNQRELQKLLGRKAG